MYWHEIDVALCCILQVTFVPDASVFSPGINFDSDTIVSRLRELAFLNAGATMKLRMLKNGVPIAVRGSSGSSSKAAKQAAAAPDKPKRRSSRKTAAVDADAAGSSALAAGSNGSSNGVAAAEHDGWQVFCYQDGLKEYVQWYARLTLLVKV
jgi:DNA gyrase/topoisomerase IV subunit B